LEPLKECFFELEKSYSKNTVHEAQALRRNLEDCEFLFWLQFFHKIMPHIDILYSQIQCRQIDTIKIKKDITNFIRVVEQIRNEVKDITIEETESGSKRRRIESCRIADAIEVCDRITTEARDRFEKTTHLDAAKLLGSANFEEFSKKFPDNFLDMAVENYPMLNKRGLQTELSVLYERPDFRNIDGAIPLLQLIYSSNLQDTFSEVTTLLKIIVTIPMTTAEPERCFSSLKRIKTFVRNSMHQERLTALAMLSIEKKLINSMGDFNTKVIEKFASKKNRRMDFNFRL